MVFLVFMADEFIHGRTLEVGDMFFSRIRYLGFGIETGKWGVSDEFLPYKDEEHALVPDPVVDEAVRLHDRKIKRASALAAAGKGASQR